jgi:hypothetical protein
MQFLDIYDLGMKWCSKCEFTMIIVYRIIVINTTITKKVKTINDHNKIRLHIVYVQY